jgi:hypothetical protein
MVIIPIVVRNRAEITNREYVGGIWRITAHTVAVTRATAVRDPSVFAVGIAKSFPVRIAWIPQKDGGKQYQAENDQNPSDSP